MSHPYAGPPMPQGYPMGPFAGIPVRPPMIQHLSQQQQHIMYAPSPPPQQLHQHPSPMPKHMNMNVNMGGQGQMSVPGPQMQMRAGLGMPTQGGMVMSSQAGGRQVGGGAAGSSISAAQQQKPKKQKRTHDGAPIPAGQGQRPVSIHPAAQAGPPEFTQTIEEELMVDELDKVNARDLAMHRFRSRHEYMNEVLSPVSIAQLGDPIDPYRDVDKTELARKVDEMEKKNVELEKQSEDRFRDMRERFAAIGRGEVLAG